MSEIKARCGSGIISFPYKKEVEASDGGWVAGGAGNDWVWDSPSKSFISAAGGSHCCPYCVITAGSLHFIFFHLNDVG